MFSFLKRRSRCPILTAAGAAAAAPRVLAGLLWELPERLLTVQQAVASGAWPGGPCTDLTLVLDDQLHHLRPLRAGQWYCFVAVHPADANLALTKDVVRRGTAEG